MNDRKGRQKPASAAGPESYADATRYFRTGQLEMARRLLLNILASNPSHIPSLNLLAIISAQTRRPDEAERYFRRIIRLQPRDPNPHNNLGNLLLASGRVDQARNAYRQALRLDPAYPEAAYNLGRIHQGCGQLDEAEAAYRQALRHGPTFFAAHAALGRLLHTKGRPAEAEQAFRAALRIRPDGLEALNGLAVLLQDHGHFAEAERLLREAVRLAPHSSESHNNLGQLLRKGHRLAEAEVFFRESLRLRPDAWEVHNNLGLTLKDGDRPAEAESEFLEALRLNPDALDAHNNLGLLLKQSGRLAEARDCLEHLTQIAPDYRYALGLLADVRASLCDWSRHRETAEALATGVAQGKGCVEPFTFMKLADDPDAQRRCAARFLADWHTVTPMLDAAIPRYSHDRIRLAYLSGDFREHPVAHLIEELLAAHDRAGFELVAVSFGPNRQDAVRARLMNHFDRFLDVRDESDEAVARRLRAMEIDIAVDLAGFTSHSRTGVLAHRPAPIQVNYLGFPGTLSAPYIDYVIADRVIIPEAARTTYTEKVVYLPDTFLPTSRWEIADHTPGRNDLDLPEKAFVFCCFNNPNKIHPSQFDCWMRLLTKTDGSVLWLASRNPLMAESLRKEAQTRGVDPARLVFAQRASAADHLARHRQADLFLDTLPFNAITTAADALWAGLPVITCRGRSYPARACASLLNAVGLPELVVDTVEEYEALALELAHRPDRLAAIREKLERNRTTHPLFDTQRFRCNLEAAYRTMWEIWQSGAPPKAFSVGG